MSVSAVTRRVSAPSVDSRSGTAGQMPTDALLLPPLRDAPSTLSQPGSPHSFHENRPPDAPRPLLDPPPRSYLLDPALALAPSQVHPTASTKTVRRMRLDRCWIRFPVVVCWTPPWLWHPARFTPQPPRKPSAGCASTVAACASPWLLLDHSALALAPSQVHPTASTKTVRRMRLDRCWIRFPVVVCWTPPWLWHPARFTPQLPRKPSAGCASTVAGSASPWLFAGPRPGSGTQPGSPHSFHENRPPDAPRPLPHALPRGCCWTTPPWLWHPARFTSQLPRKPSAGCASTVAGCASPWLFAGPRPGSGTQPGSPHSKKLKLAPCPHPTTECETSTPR